MLSRTHHAPAGVWRIALIGALALAALLAALSSSPSRAEAAFTTPQCQGADITGRGASFARDAHQVFRLQFQTLFCAGSGPAVDYESLGSGAGRRVVGERTSGSGTADNTTGAASRNQIPRFGMTDEPLNESVGKPQIIMGTDATGDESPIHQIPAAVGATATLVNFPNGCDVNRLALADKTPEQDRNGNSIPDDVVRVRFSKMKLEKAFASDDDSDNWIELFPELRNSTAFPVLANDPCNKDIVRVVRFDESGTTFTLKDYLNRILPSRMWRPTFTDTAPALTRAWPNAGPADGFGPRMDCTAVNGVFPSGPGVQGDNTTGSVDQLVSACSNGNGALVTKLSATDGSIGYSDISTARTAGLAITPEATTPPGGDNDVYWTQSQNGAGGTNASTPQAGNQFTEPTADPFGFRTDGQPGANCAQTTFVNVPSSTLGDFSNASGVNSPVGFGVCSLTYGLLFDDYKKAYGLQTDQAAEERKARTVKDYWTSVVSDGSQAALLSKDYAPLPSTVLGVARAGVAAVGFDKAATGGGGTPTPTPNPTPTPTPNPTPTPTTPSNKFSIVRTALSSRTGGVTFSIRVPGRGRIAVGARAGRIKVGSIVRTVSRAGTYKLTLKPGRKAKSILRRRGRLRVKVTFTFKPTGGTTRRVTRTVTLKLRRPRR